MSTADQPVSLGRMQTLGDASQLHFTYDAWGRVVNATGNDGAVFAYAYRLDAFGRIISRIKYRMDENGRSTQVLERVKYFYDGNNVIEEQIGGAVSTQYVWAPDGKLILRDRNADGKSGTGNLGKAGSGLEERTYALTDALGSVVAITDASGQLLERYVYRENGSMRALRADWSGWPEGVDHKSSRYGWVYLWHGGRSAELVKSCLQANQYDGSYIFAGGTWYDARHGTTMQPDPSLLAMGRNAYNGPELEWYHKANIFGTQAVAWLLGPEIGLPVSAFVGGYQRAGAGQNAWQVAGGGVLDATGVSAVVGAVTNRDLVTMQYLGLSGGERMLNLGLGILQVWGMGQGWGNGLGITAARNIGEMAAPYQAAAMRAMGSGIDHALQSVDSVGQAFDSMLGIQYMGGTGYGSLFPRGNSGTGRFVDVGNDFWREGWLASSSVSRVHPTLPAYGTRGAATSGTMVVGDDYVYLVSGRGPASAVPWLDVYAVQTHVEAHAAALMHEQNLAEAMLYINKPSGPCIGGAGCWDLLPEMLPTGATLHVYWPDGYSVFRGL